MRERQTLMPYLSQEEFGQLKDAVRVKWQPKPLDELVAHRAVLKNREETLLGYDRRSGPQERELEETMAEGMLADELIAESATVQRAEKIAAARRAYADPANRE